MIAPILDEIAIEYAGKIKICKVDVDGNPESAAKFNVRGIPTLLVFKNGAVEATKVGALSKGSTNRVCRRSYLRFTVALVPGPQNSACVCTSQPYNLVLVKSFNFAFSVRTILKTKCLLRQ